MGRLKLKLHAIRYSDSLFQKFMRPRWNVFAQRIHLPRQTLGVFRSAIIKKKLIIYVSGNISGLKANPTTFTDQINEFGFDTSKIDSRILRQNVF